MTGTPKGRKLNCAIGETHLARSVGRTFSSPPPPPHHRVGTGEVCDALGVTPNPREARPSESSSHQALGQIGGAHGWNMSRSSVSHADSLSLMLSFWRLRTCISERINFTSRSLSSLRTGFPNTIGPIILHTTSFVGGLHGCCGAC